MWAVRTFGWTMLTIGILSVLAIPLLVMAGRGEETPEALIMGAVGVLLGVVIVRFVTRPEP